MTKLQNQALSYDRGKKLNFFLVSKEVFWYNGFNN